MAEKSKFNPKNPDAWGISNMQYLIVPAVLMVLFIGM